MNDISENKAALNDRKKVKQYVESRYLNRLTSDVELQIYRSLWKLVFKLDNEVCEKNRIINLQVLEVIGKRNAGKLNELINGDQDYYSNIAPSGGRPISFLIFYLSQNDNLYKLLAEDAQIKIRHCIEKDRVGRTLGWFVKDDLDTHFDDILTWIEGDENPTFDEKQWDYLLEINDSEEWQELFCKLVGAYYACSRSYDQADTRFKRSIELHIHLFNLNSMRFTIERIETNSQTHRRGSALVDHPKVKKRILEIDLAFNFEKYPCFAKTAEDDEKEDV